MSKEQMIKIVNGKCPLCDGELQEYREHDNGEFIVKDYECDKCFSDIAVTYDFSSYEIEYDGTKKRRDKSKQN